MRGTTRVRTLWLVAATLGSAVTAGCGGSGEGDVWCRDGGLYAVAYGIEDSTFHVGPYLGHTTKRSVAVGWETLVAGDTVLEYGQDATYGKQVEGSVGTMHQIVVEGLEPGTTYHYRACTDGRCTGDLTFSTAPWGGTPIRFSVYGDCQDNPETHAQVVEQVMADEANLVVVVGDTVGDGQVREQYKERYFDPARRLAHHVPRYAAIGNHDRKDVEGVNFRDYNIHPEDPDVPQTEVSYSFTFGDVFFLVYDATLDHLDVFFPLGREEPPLWQWLQAQAASEEAQAAKWRFAFAHYPPNTNCSEEGASYALPESAVQDYVLPMLWENGFHGYFAGHVHCYERFDYDGHLVITTGGGGGGVEPDEQCDDELPQAQLNRCVHHHVTVEAGCDEARVWARDIEGNVIEELLLYPDGSHSVVTE